MLYLADVGHFGIIDNLMISVLNGTKLTYIQNVSFTPMEEVWRSQYGSAFEVISN